MKIMRHYMFSVALAALCGLMGGCGESDHPFSEPGSAKVDKELFGVWYSPKVLDLGFGDSEPPNCYLHIGKAGNLIPSSGDGNFPNKKSDEILVYKNFMRMVLVMNERKGVTSTSFVFFPTKIGEKSYGNTPYFSDDNTIKDYHLWKYEVDGDKLTIWWPMNLDVIEEFSTTLGLLRERIFWRFGVFDDSGKSPENLAMSKLAQNVALPKARQQANQDRKFTADNWHEEARETANRIRARSPNLKTKSAIAHRVVKELRASDPLFDKSWHTVRKFI